MRVLDASALLAMLFSEPGGKLVARHLDEDDCVVSTVNYSEVIARFARDGHDAKTVDEQMIRLPFRLVDFDRQIARSSAALAPVTRVAGLSFADRACLASALQLDAVAVTADRAWGQISLPVTIELVR